MTIERPWVSSGPFFSLETRNGNPRFGRVIFCQRLADDARNSLTTPTSVPAEYAAEVRPRTADRPCALSACRGAYFGHCSAACYSAQHAPRWQRIKVSFLVHLGFQGFRCLEGDNPAGGDRRRDARLRIAPGALALLANGELAKTMKAHVFAGDERGDDFFEDGFDQCFGLTAREARASRIDGASDFPLRQSPSRPILRSRRSVGDGFRNPRCRGDRGSLGGWPAASFIQNLHGGCLSCP